MSDLVGNGRRPVFLERGSFHVILLISPFRTSDVVGSHGDSNKHLQHRFYGELTQLELYFSFHRIGTISVFTKFSNIL